MMSQEAEGLVRLVCPVCSGRGSSACPFCQGRGSIELESEAFILIPAGVEDGARLVLPGLGHKDFFRSGDLILQVEIQR